LIIDEAAAIPITIVKQLMGPYLVLLSSTINGYEGTGRSLSLKLINQLREQNRPQRQHYGQYNQNVSAPATGRLLKEVSLDEPIRYGLNDPIEKWLNDLLCLKATEEIDQLKAGCPHPN
jgi:N-acetyltransferase 10